MKWHVLCMSLADIVAGLEQVDPRCAVTAQEFVELMAARGQRPAYRFFANLMANGSSKSSPLAVAALKFAVDPAKRLIVNSLSLGCDPRHISLESVLQEMGRMHEIPAPTLSGVLRHSKLKVEVGGGRLSLLNVVTYRFADDEAERVELERYESMSNPEVDELRTQSMYALRKQMDVGDRLRV